MTEPYKYVCADCGSDSIVSDASAVWDVEKQDWVLSDICEASYCEDCEETVNVEQAPVEST